MQRTYALVILILGLALNSPLAAAAAKGAGEALMKKSDCFSCHQVKRKVVGPAFVDIAKKYKGDKKAVALLVKKVKDGGSGVWGSIPMAGHPALPEKDIEEMVKFVLAQK